MRASILFCFLFIAHSPLRRPRRAQPLQINLAVVLDFFAVLQNFLHDGPMVRALLKLHAHLQSHEVHRRVLHARSLLRRLLHFVRAVRAVDIDLIRLLHPKLPLSLFQLNNQTIAQSLRHIIDTLPQTVNKLGEFSARRKFRRGARRSCGRTARRMADVKYIKLWETKESARVSRDARHAHTRARKTKRARGDKRELLNHSGAGGERLGQ